MAAFAHTVDSPEMPKWIGAWMGAWMGAERRTVWLPHMGDWIRRKCNECNERDPGMQVLKKLGPGGILRMNGAVEALKKGDFKPLEHILQNPAEYGLQVAYDALCEVRGCPCIPPAGEWGRTGICVVRR
jgi:hypothetical protein